MTQVTSEIPDDLARSLEDIAAEQHRSVQDLTVEHLKSVVLQVGERRPGSAAAILRAMLNSPHLTAADVDELDTAIAAGRLPVRDRGVFEPRL